VLAEIKQKMHFFIDIDGLKAINNAFGHKAGDELLTHISQLLQSCI
jgi:diguanylate cyclase (GGDEF)-like protein